MFTALIPKSFRDLLDEFKGCFTQPGFENFSSLSLGWILCTGCHRITRVIQAAGVFYTDTRKHHSSLYRFLSVGSWCVDAVARVIFKLFLPYLPQEITLLVDDTLGHKSGPHIFGAAMHFDAAKSTYGRGTKKGGKKFFAFGHNWVITAILVPLPWAHGKGLAIPFLFRLYRSKKSCPPEKFRKRTAMAAEMVKLVTSWLPQGRQLHVVGDSEYACYTLVLNMPENTTFTGPMVMNAAIYTPAEKYQGHGRPPKKGQRLLSPQKLAKSKKRWRTITVHIYGRDVKIKVKSMTGCIWYTVAGAKLITMVVTRDPTGRIEDRAYFTTVPDCSVEELLTQFARRWEIEVSFRNMKQSLGLEDPQNGWWRRKAGSPRPRKRPGPNPREHRGEKAINHTLSMVFCANALTLLWYLKHGNPQKDVAWARQEASWYRQKTLPSFNDMLAALRKSLWMARLFQYPGIALGRKVIEAALPHWNLAA